MKIREDTRRLYIQAKGAVPVLMGLAHQPADTLLPESQLALIPDIPCSTLQHDARFTQDWPLSLALNRRGSLSAATEVEWPFSDISSMEMCLAIYVARQERRCSTEGKLVANVPEVVG